MVLSYNREITGMVETDSFQMLAEAEVATYRWLESTSMAGKCEDNAAQLDRKV